MSSEALTLSLIGFFGIALTTLGAIIVARINSRQADKAGRRDETVQADKTGIEGLKVLVDENRQERKEMREELTKVRKELADVRARLQTLEQERVAMSARIAELESVKAILLHYIQRLRKFIRGNGNVPPEPDRPLSLPLDLD